MGCEHCYEHRKGGRCDKCGSESVFLTARAGKWLCCRCLLGDKWDIPEYHVEFVENGAYTAIHGYNVFARSEQEAILVVLEAYTNAEIGSVDRIN